MNPEELIDDIYEKIKYDQAFDHLRQSSNPFVPGEGATDGARAFIIGEAPGAYEAVKRRPFVGPAGKVQRQLMELARLWSVEHYAPGIQYNKHREPNCWLTNVLHYRPPRNRKPTPTEIEASRPYIVDEWKAVGSPRIIVAVGASALAAIAPDLHASILKIAGTCLERIDRHRKPIYVWPMIHPAFGLRNKAVQPLIERDWQRLAEWMRGSATH
ncbi:MAG TPA: uracil-DNA glycosylase [Candidatus Paceibacterota bacterium]